MDPDRCPLVTLTISTVGIPTNMMFIDCGAHSAADLAASEQYPGPGTEDDKDEKFMKKDDFSSKSQKMIFNKVFIFFIFCAVPGYCSDAAKSTAECFPHSVNLILVSIPTVRIVRVIRRHLADSKENL